MSMVQIPGSDGVFLATHKFCSPNDSREAMIVMAAPGKVYACELPGDMESCDEDHPLPFQVLKEGLLKNYGYCRRTDDNGDYAVIGAECGVIQFIPPAARDGAWETVRLLDKAASDIACIDFQENGEPDMLTITPFHGDTVMIFRKIEGEYREIYKAFPEIGGIVHTHSGWATSWAQAGRGIPCYGTTHADYFKGKEYMAMPACLCKNHGPFAWGKKAKEAVYHAVVLEEVAKMASWTEMINSEVKPAPQELQDKHYQRKHGANAYYGQRQEQLPGFGGRCHMEFYNPNFTIF